MAIFSLGIEGWWRAGGDFDNEIKAVFSVLPRLKLIICPRRGPSLSKHRPRDQVETW
jgi:hypothetical protein